MRSRLHYVDFLKATAMFLVCYYHFTSLRYAWSGGRWYLPNLDYLSISLAAMGVPLFLMVNGALLLNKALNLRNHIKKTMKVYLCSVVWKYITILCLQTQNRVQATAFDYIKVLFTNSFKPLDLSLYWFMDALLFIYLMVPLIKFAYDHSHKLRLYLLALLFISPFATDAVNFACQFIAWVFHFRFTAINFGLFDILGWHSFTLFYFVLGAVLHRTLVQEQVRFNRLYAYAGFVLGWLLLTALGSLQTHRGVPYDTVFDGYRTVFCVLMSTATFALMTTLRSQETAFRRAVEAISENTFGIYFIHWIIGYMLISGLYRGLSFLHIGSILLNVLHALFLLASSLGLTLVVKRLPLLKHTITLSTR